MSDAAARADGPPLRVIGLAGGVGAGKSEVAGMLAQLGCVVVDSDAQGREALGRPEVRDELVRWWGAGILNPRGEVDRSKVAAIVFRDAVQRRRLEALTHPLIEMSRAKVFRQAEQARAKACVIDAPLLFEAGLDRQCDALVFVDSPRELREARVKATRGWEPAELARREAAQMPLEEKRARCAYSLINHGDRADLEKKVRSALGAILAGPAA